MTIPRSILAATLLMTALPACAAEPLPLQAAPEAPAIEAPTSEAPAAGAPATGAPAPEGTSGSTADPASGPVMRLLSQPTEGIGPSSLALAGLKEFIRSGRAYEQCGVQDLDVAVERELDVLRSRLEEMVGVDSATTSDLLIVLAETNPEHAAAVSDAVTAFSSLQAFYASVTAPLKAAAGRLVGALYAGSAAEQGVVWSNAQVADACSFISGYLRNETR